MKQNMVHADLPWSIEDGSEVGKLPQHKAMNVKCLSCAFDLEVGSGSLWKASAD